MVQVSTVLGFVIKSQREEAAWTEGIAIWVAVAVVSGVGAPCHADTRMDVGLAAGLPWAVCARVIHCHPSEWQPAMLLEESNACSPFCCAAMSALCSLQGSHVGAGNDYQKDQQFKKLNAARASYDVKVLRAGANVLVPNTGPHLPTNSWLACDPGPGSDVMHAALQIHGMSGAWPRPSELPLLRQIASSQPEGGRQAWPPSQMSGAWPLCRQTGAGAASARTSNSTGC